VQVPLNLLERIRALAAALHTSMGRKCRQWLEEGLMRDEGALEGDLYSRYVLLQSQLDTALMLVERLRDRLSHYGENV
jgi:hypothetical protein